jgi:FtsP/CotA-like multicopper oxidase with cupredoxin domain
MRRLIPFLAASATLAAALTAAPQARADWDDRPGFDFHGQVAPDAPCGVGTPARGHFPREVSPSSLPQGLKLTVQQDAHRLCYVSGNIAEAPTLRIRQGADFSVTLRNDITDPAAIANFVAINPLDSANERVPAEAGYYPVLPGMHHAATGATNLHMHGFAVPPVAPQDEVLKGCVDPAVGPARCGRREMTYHYHVPADMPAGLYWYHPHVHGEVHAQMLMGLSGAVVVEGPEDDARRAAGIQDRIFIIRQSQDLDIKTAAAPAAATPADPESPPPPGIAAATAKPEGDTIDTAHEQACSNNTGLDEITLNGSKVIDGAVADADLAPINMASGTTQLWRVLNAANDAFLDLALIDQDGKALPVSVVARDGVAPEDDAGHHAKPVPTTQSQLVPPSGRIEFLVTAPPVGTKVYFVTHAVDTGCTGDKVPERKLALINTVAVAASAADTREPAAVAEKPDLFAGLMSRPTDRERIIALAEYPRPGKDDQTDFYIMERKPGAKLEPYEMGGPPLITMRAGTVEEWTVENWSNELHAFHIHQVHFRLLSTDGKPEPETPLLDVVNVPYAKVVDGTVVPGRVRLKLSVPDELAGDIPFHCHLVDHEDNGMMAVLRVLPSKLGAAEGGTRAADAASEADILAHPPICRPADPAGQKG